MKKHLLFAGCALLALGSIPASAATTVWFVPGAVDLRAGPHDNFPVVANIPSRANMDLHGCLQDWSWCDVSWNGNRGWVSGRNIQSVEQNRTSTVMDVGPQLSVPVTTYDTKTYWNNYYQSAPFYSKREQYTTWSSDGSVSKTTTTTTTTPEPAPAPSSATSQ